MRKAESNPTHYAMAALQKMGYVSSIITVSRSLSFAFSLALANFSTGRHTNDPNSPLRV